MRSIEYLVQLFPDKTGRELMEIQEKDRVADQFAYEQAHKKDLKLIKDINTNGGFYRGKFGIDQLYYYSFSNMIMEFNEIYCDCEHVVLFTGEGRVTDEFSVRIDKKTYQQFNKYAVEMCERITIKEWEAVINYFKKVSNYFGHSINSIIFTVSI